MFVMLLLTWWNATWINQLGNESYYHRQFATMIVTISVDYDQIKEATKNQDLEIAHRAELILMSRENIYHWFLKFPTELSSHVFTINWGMKGDIVIQRTVTICDPPVWCRCLIMITWYIATQYQWEFEVQIRN